MDQKEEQKRQKSSVDRANEFIGKSQRAYNNARKLRNVYRGIRAARTAATATSAAAATSEIWVPILIILLIILFIVVIFVVIFGGAANTIEPIIGGPPPACESIGGTCQASGISCTSPAVLDTLGATCSASTSICCVPPGIYTCPSGDYLACLKQDFNIVVTGPASSTVIKNIYLSFAFASKSSMYRSLLMAGGNTLYIQDIARTTGCGGLQVDANLIKLYDGACSNASLGVFRHFIIHESGHIISARNPRLYQAYPHSSLSQSDSSCFQYSSCGSNAGYFLKSYALRYYCAAYSSKCVDINARYESFAESISDYLTSTNGYTGALCSVTINNFNSTCSNTFTWLKTNVYGGYTFY